MACNCNTNAGICNTHARTKEYTYPACSHKKCVGHSPNWENIGPEKRILRPLGLFGKLYFGFETLTGTGGSVWCCGKFMECAFTIKKQKCTLCGREEEHEEESSSLGNCPIVVCSCCGKENTYGDGY